MLILYKMRFMDFEDAKNQAPKDKTLGTRGNQKASRHSSDISGCRGIRLASTAIRYQSLGADRANWEGTGVRWCSQSRGILSGGIIEQLIEEARDQLAQIEEERQKLAQRLEGLEALREQLGHKEQ